MFFSAPIHLPGIHDPAFPIQGAFNEKAIDSRGDGLPVVVRAVPLVGQIAVGRSGACDRVDLCGGHFSRFRFSDPVGDGVFSVFVTAFRREGGGVKGADDFSLLVFNPNGVLAGSDTPAVELERDCQSVAVIAFRMQVIAIQAQCGIVCAGDGSPVVFHDKFSRAV